MIDAVNKNTSGLSAIVHSLGGEEKDPENVVHDRVEVTVPVSNDVDENSLKLEGANENGELVVEGEGTWSVEDGKIVFTPEDGFVYDPTPIKYSMTKKDGTKMQAQTLEVNYPGLLRDDVEVSSDLKDTVVIDVLKNDNGDLNISTIKISIPEGFMDEHPGTTFEKSAAQSGKVLKVAEQGTWRVLGNGTISYEPLTDVEPTPIQYEVYDNKAGKVLTSADITIKKTEVAGVSNEEACQTSDSIPTLSKWGMGLTAIIGSIFGLFLFRKERK